MCICRHPWAIWESNKTTTELSEQPCQLPKKIANSVSLSVSVSNCRTHTCPVDDCSYKRRVEGSSLFTAVQQNEKKWARYKNCSLLQLLPQSESPPAAAYLSLNEHKASLKSLFDRRVFQLINFLYHQWDRFLFQPHQGPVLRRFWFRQQVPDYCGFCKCSLICDLVDRFLRAEVQWYGCKKLQQEHFFFFFFFWCVNQMVFKLCMHAQSTMRCMVISFEVEL